MRGFIWFLTYHYLAYIILAPSTSTTASTFYPTTTQSTLAPETSPTTTLPCVPDWTWWMSANNPNDEGDSETYQGLVSAGHHICSENMITSLQCGYIRTERDGTDVVVPNVQDNVLCSMKDGLSCDNSMRSPGQKCHNYAIRFYCSCPPIATTRQPGLPLIFIC